MKTEVRITRKGVLLYQRHHDIADAHSFGQAFEEAWEAMKGKRLEAATSIGELYDDLENAAEALDGIVISLHKMSV